MTQKYEPVIGLEIHAVMETKSKMFCSCPVVDSTHDNPNTAVCPVCSGMPGVLPVVNRGAVEYALKVALALGCEVSLKSIFARKSYFYPDLPKGYQISQYEQPLATNGKMFIDIGSEEHEIRIRRVHLEEDTGKLTHISSNGDKYSLVDLNRSGIPLLEIVSEPDLHSVEAVKTYAYALRRILRYVGVNSGNLEKGLLRIEPNISLRPIGSKELGTRTEIKNLNSFRSLERGVAYEIERQTKLLDAGEEVVQQTMGWDDDKQVTVPQRSKEDAEDYRYFPEPDLPPLVLDKEWVEEIRASLPEMPYVRYQRFKKEYGLSEYDANVLTNEQDVAAFYEAVINAAPAVSPKTISNWVSGDLFSLMNQKNTSIKALNFSAEDLAELLQLISDGEINQNTGNRVLAEMFESGKPAGQIVDDNQLRQISEPDILSQKVKQVLEENPEEVANYLGGKESLSHWLFGQVMKAVQGKANPEILRKELDSQLEVMKETHQK